MARNRDRSTNRDFSDDVDHKWTPDGSDYSPEDPLNITPHVLIVDVPMEPQTFPDEPKITNGRDGITHILPITVNDAVNRQGRKLLNSIKVPPANGRKGSPTSISLSGIPAIEPWKGALDFTVQFGKEQSRAKATPWIFSTMLNKLFVGFDTACPVTFLVNVPPHLTCNYNVRGQIVYALPQDCATSVQRCPSHQLLDASQFPHPAHVLRCDERTAVYEDHENGRHSVVVGLKPPRGGTQGVTVYYRFMCRSSCIGTINRRPTKLLFSLENMDGEEVGRDSVDIRICSCPGRDLKTEEERTLHEQLHPGSHDYPKKRKAPGNVIDSAALHMMRFAPSIRSQLHDDDQVYWIQVRGRRNFEMAQDYVNRIMAQHNDTMMASTSNGRAQSADNEVNVIIKEEP